MIRIYKANMVRLVKNPFFLGGCALAFLLTLLAATHRMDNILTFLAAGGPDQIMFFMSAAMVAFFTIFTVIYTNTEYSNGVIRNKVISGCSQSQVYLSHYLTNVSAAVIMFVFYCLGGFLGGARYNAYFFKANIAFMFALFAYIAAVNAIAMRLKKVVFAIVASMLLLNTAFNAVMFGNLILSLLEGKALFIGSVIYNLSPLGQWFVYTGFTDETCNPGFAIQMVSSIVMIVLITLIGMLGINKRDLV